MNIKIIVLPILVALSFLFGACAEQTIEVPDAVDGAVEEGFKGIEQGAEDAVDAVQDGAKDLRKGAEDAVDAVQDGAKDLRKGAEDAAGAAQDGIKQGVEDAGNAINDLGDKIPGSKSE